MSVHSEIEETLYQVFSPAHLLVHDGSEEHHGHQGQHEGRQGTHFSILIVSETFAGKSRLERHRLVCEALQPLFHKGLHAVQIQAKTPEEHKG